MWCKVLYIADLFCLHGNIRPGNITISFFVGALKLFFNFFVFLVTISRLYSSHGVPLSGDNVGPVMPALSQHRDTLCQR